MLLYSSPLFLEHDTGQHPEKAERLRRISQHLEKTKLDQQCVRPDIKPVSLERLTQVHSPDYVNEIQEFAANRTGYIEADTVVSKRSFEVALNASGVVCDATERVIQGPEKRALCLIRPPGHHALENAAMGFCLFNHVVVAARTAIQELGMERVLIIDWDVHHGNGTQDLTWRDPRIAFFSIHRHPFYPGTGSADETGTGDALGTKKNLPVKFGTPRKDYLARFTSELETFADKIRPDLVLISAGFDAHQLDPVGSLGLDTEDFAQLTKVVIDIAEMHSKGRIVSLLEGGYNVDVLPDCVEAHLRELMKPREA